MRQDLLLYNAQDFGNWSADPNRPDYACPAYQQMAPRWQLVNDVRGGTNEIRRKKEMYLPRFEAETPRDWEARVAMTFLKDHYAMTLEEHVGLVFATPPQLGDDVPDQLKELAEDIDGEGNHLEVFAETAFDSALHFGHCVLYTDYPVAESIRNLRDQRRANARPYVTLYRAPDVLSWRTVVVGGVVVIAQIKFRESSTAESGEFGVTDSVSYREVKQEVFYDVVTGRATGLGRITWRTWREDKTAVHADATGTALAGHNFIPTGEGVIVGPERIPARIVYGGRKLGYLHTMPHLLGLGFSNVEETQVESDYANVMHKCNVPTPVFIGRTQSPDGNNTVQMGQGIDIPAGGDAKMLEPAGSALGATRTRLEDLRAYMQQQGATSANPGGKVMTATEAAMYAKQRNAKLRRGARSLQDALEGVLEDMAAFLKLGDGGSVVVTQDFAGQAVDPQIAALLWQAVSAGQLDIKTWLTYVKTGQLPDDVEDTVEMLRVIRAQQLADDESSEAEQQKGARADKRIPEAA